MMMRLNTVQSGRVGNIARHSSVFKCVKISYPNFILNPIRQTRNNQIQRVTLRINALATTAEISPVKYESLLKWCIEEHGLPASSLEPAAVENWDSTEIVGLVANKNCKQGDILLEIPGDLAVTSVDVQKDPALAALAEGRSELVGLALWLVKERYKGTASSWAPLLATYPQQTLTPILWDEAERQELLKGSTVLNEARTRQAALQQEWQSLLEIISADTATYPAVIYTEEAFMQAMSVVLAYGSYLPSAQCFALLPLVGTMNRTGSAGGAILDYDLDRQSVTLVASQPTSAGQEVKLFDGRPNGELLLATGTMEPTNPADLLTMNASLIAADRLYSTKREILTTFGFEAAEEFPIYEDRIALQQLAYLRLARIQDAAQLAKVSFDNDVIISQENEYEILQLMMGDLRERLQGYPTEFEQDLKELQRQDLNVKERLAIQLRFCEKRILRGTMNGVRKKLAPIRGIPTKAGFQDPNADFKEIFDTLEAIPTAPKKLVDGILSWARGEQDPDWKKSKEKRMVMYQEKTVKDCKKGIEDIKLVEFVPSEAIEAALCFHHGIAEHSGRYKEVFTKLANRNIAVYSFDAIGHGNSTGVRLYFEKMSDLVNQLHTVVGMAKDDLKIKTGGNTNVPIFLGGQSLGGLVATLECHAHQADYAGLVLSAPALDVEMGPVLKVQAALGGLLSAVVPKARIVPAVDPKFLNKDSQKVAEYVNDPLNSPGNLPARVGNEALKGFKWLRPRYGDFTLPILALHGGQDKVTSLKGTRAFVDGASSSDKTLTVVQDGYHEMLFETNGPELIHQIGTWILAHAKKTAAAAENGGGSMNNNSNTEGTAAKL